VDTVDWTHAVVGHEELFLAAKCQASQLDIRRNIGVPRSLQWMEWRGCAGADPGILKGVWGKNSLSGSKLR